MSPALQQKIARFIIFPLWRSLDFFIPKKDNFWAFPVHHIKSELFIENPRAVFEQVKRDPKIKKIIFSRLPSSDFQLEDAVNTEIVHLQSLKGLMRLLQCKVIFVTNSVSMEYSWRWESKLFSVLKVLLKKRIFVNLSHGISLKKINAIANEKVKNHLHRVEYRMQEPLYYKGLIASSEVDSCVMTTMYHPVNPENVWLTGLPRNDFLLMDKSQLPRYIRTSIDKLQSIKQQQRLVVYAPTYRQTTASQEAYYYQFQEEEIEQLKNILKKHNAILGYRPHYFKNTEKYFNLDKYIDNQYIFICDQHTIPEFSALVRECDVLITDYSSVALEGLYLNKASFSFAYDLKNYETEQNGLIYDLDMIFSQQVFQSFGALMQALDQVLQEEKSAATSTMLHKLFFHYRDCNNSDRVVKRVKALINLPVSSAD